MAYKVVFRASDRTLTDEEVQAVHGKVLDALKEKLGVTLRDM